MTQLPDLDESSIATLLPENIWPGLFSWFGQPYFAPPRITKKYPIREPYPVALTQPVLVWDAAGRTPNLQIIQGLP